jgi:hypothetical protein
MCFISYSIVNLFYLTVLNFESLRFLQLCDTGFIVEFDAISVGKRLSTLLMSYCFRNVGPWLSRDTLSCLRRTEL